MSFIPMDIAKKEGGGELTGNALPSQVRAGKTFYNTDPDNILTGVMGSYIKCKNINTMSDLVSTLPYNFYYGSTVVYNNEIHILGGGGGAIKHYKWNGSTWTSVSTIPFNFYYGSAVVYNNEIHILGGNGNNTAHYKWNGSTWSSVSTLLHRFSDSSAVVYNDEIHILGGIYNSDDFKMHQMIKNNGITYQNVFKINGNDSIYVEGEFYRNSAVLDGVLVANSTHKYYMPKGSVWLLVCHGYNKTNGANVGMWIGTLKTSGGSSSTTALGAPTSQQITYNGTAPIKFTLGADTSFPSGYSNGSYGGYFVVGCNATSTKLEYNIVPLLTPIGEFAKDETTINK